MISGFLAALIGLASAILGGIIQAYATGKFERSKFERQVKWELYSAYFVSLGELTFYDRDSDRHIGALATMAQVRSRIAIHGSDEVVQAVAKVFRFPDLLTEGAQNAMADAVAAMRRDVGQAGGKATPEELKQLMFASRTDK